MTSLAQLQRSDLFRSVPPEILQELLRRAQKVSCRRGRSIYDEGDTGDTFYFVLSGQFASYRMTASHKREYLNFYAAGDCFGEVEMLQSGLPRASSVECLAGGSLLRIDPETFFWIWEAAPLWAARVSRVVQDQRAESEMGGEIELVSEHRHPLVLVESLLLPVLVALVAFLALFAATSRHFVPAAFFPPALIVLGIVFVAWIVWAYEDWRGDIFIVTNRRVVHIEEVPLVSAKRSEALVGQIRGVRTDTPTMGRVFGFKTLIIQTGTTLETIEFIGLADADEISRTIIGVRDAIQADSSIAEKRRNLRAYLEQPASSAEDEEDVREPDSVTTGDDRGGHEVRHRSAASRRRTWLLYFIPRMSRIDGSTVIWQRHWYVLVRLTVFPLLFSLLLLLLLAWVLLGGALPLDLRGAWVARVLFIFWLATLIWLFWRYEDWRNDYYALNDAQIVDRNSLPLGFDEQRQVFSLDSVQNVRSDVPTILSRLLLMGDVYIDTIGGTESVKFDCVFNPVEIQRQVMQRVGAVRQRERQQRAAEMGEWFAAYRSLLDDDEGELAADDAAF